MRMLGLDFGARRIGLALSDPTGTLARPWRTLERGGEDGEAVRAVAEIVARLACEEEGLEAIVIGLPRRLDGTAHAMTDRVRAFAAALAAGVTMRVVLQDERLSSREAERRLSLNERDWRKRKLVLDAASAAVVLQDYLDERAAGGAPADAEEP
jgi:putative Holliday junction resolvase